MKTFEVILVKSYIIKIKSKNKQKAKKYAELFTGDINDISTKEHRKNLKFEIEDIDCKMNEAFDAREIIWKKLRYKYSSDLLRCFERVGIELRTEIDKYFSKFK